MDPRCCRVFHMVGLDADIWQGHGFLGAISGLGSTGLPRSLGLSRHLGGGGAGLRCGHDSCVWDWDAPLATTAETRDHNFVGEQELLLVWVLSHGAGGHRWASPLPRVRRSFAGKSVMPQSRNSPSSRFTNDASRQAALALRANPSLATACGGCRRRLRARRPRPGPSAPGRFRRRRGRRRRFRGPALR